MVEDSRTRLCTYASHVSSFTGFPVAALDFYDDLEMDNTKSFWEAHREIYRTAVKEPMAALTAALAEEFGKAKVFRPNRDVRFAKDKSPYKTHQGAYVATGPATGWYVEISAQGVRTGAGFYDADAVGLGRFRDAVVADGPGMALEKVLSKLTRADWEVSGERLKTTPRGYPADHVRINLLRHKTLVVGRSHGFEPVIHTAELLEVVRADWRAARPLVEWVDHHCAG
jgi:uncharacterized protein (TIGR02453 family)